MQKCVMPKAKEQNYKINYKKFKHPSYLPAISLSTPITRANLISKISSKEKYCCILGTLCFCF